MEGTPESLNDKAEADEKRSVLWEKCIQQSIFVDISDDDSLHFSDLQPGSFSICLKQDSPASVTSAKFSEKSELTSSDENDEEATETSVTASGGSVTGSNSIKNSATHVPQTAGRTHMCLKGKQIPPYNDDPVNTSDEDQEDLPYDGDLANQSIQRKTSEKEEEKMDISKNTGQKTATELNILDALNLQETGMTVSQLPCSGVGAALVNDGGQHVGGTMISDLLLRHFTQEELQNSTEFIDGETLPEVSLMESLDDTVVSIFSQHIPHYGPTDFSNRDRDNSQCEQEAMTGDGSLVVSSEQEEENSPSSQVALVLEVEHCSELSHISNSAQPAKAEDPIQKCSLVRTRSFSELKYGQGQVHYPRPDFSKVSPKVKIPKANGVVRSVCPSTGILRAQSSPGMLAKSSASNIATMNVISRVLEDTIQPPEKLFVFREQQESQTSVHYLQQIQASKHPLHHSNWSEKEEFKVVGTDPCEIAATERSSQPPQTGTNKDFAKATESSTSPPFLKTKEQSEGERMTSELMAIISQFGDKVAEFKNGVSTMCIGVKEQQMVFKSMMDAQDQLERNYIAKKEEHRTLEMQNYMGTAKNTGEFDPNRQVEGELFKIGMLLEDVKEEIDTNVCHSFSPLPSTSTHAPLSTQPSLHEDRGPCFSISVDKRVQENGASGDGQTPAGSVLKPTRDSSMYSETSLERQVNAPATERESLSTPAEKENCSTVVASSVCSVTEDRLWDTVCPGLKHPVKSGCEFSRRPLDGALSSPNGNTHSLDPTWSSIQTTVSPEIDSGFGSTDLSRPTSGQSQPLSHTERVQLLSDPCSPHSMSGSDSELSTSLLHTTIATATLLCAQPCRITGANQWLNSSQQNRPNTRQDKEDGTYIHVPAIVGMGSLPPSKTHPHVCSCHNEAILALQAEVAQLKRELEERLSHLPHFSRQVAQLTQTRPRQEGRPRARPRVHQRPCSISRCTKSNSSSIKVDNWISSDMEPSKSENSGGSELSESLQKSFSVTSDFLSAQRKSQISSFTGDRQWSLKLPLSASPIDCSQKWAHHNIYLQPAKGIEDVWMKSKDLTFSTQPLQTSLLQVNYESSCSPPASFKVLEGQSHSTPRQRRHSTQLDLAPLPSDIYFQQPMASPHSSPRPRSKQRSSKDEDISRTLDKAIEAARSMKRTTEHMAKSLSADLAKAELQHKFNRLYPLEKKTGTKP